MPNRNRPNTGVDDTLLHSDVILCCGEDPQELTDALAKVIPEPALAYHGYRCYQFWRLAHFSLVWTGIGAGCLEPLLFEILESDVVQRMALIGTAGTFPGRNMVLGKIYAVTAAFPGGAGVKLPEESLPLHGRWRGLDSAPSGLLPASVVSTDYYYGFSQMADPRVTALQAADGELQKAVDKYYGNVDMVDMESAQFYHLCSLLGRQSLSYVSIKGASNYVGDGSAQTVHSPMILEAALNAGLDLFGNG